MEFVTPKKNVEYWEELLLANVLKVMESAVFVRTFSCLQNKSVATLGITFLCTSSPTICCSSINDEKFPLWIIRIANRVLLLGMACRDCH